VESAEGGRHQVRFEDLRFQSVEGISGGRKPPLSGYVVLDPELRVEEMYMGRPPGRVPKTR